MTNDEDKRAKKAEYDKVYRAKNKGRIYEYIKEYRAKNREKVAEANRLCYLSNLEKIKARYLERKVEIAARHKLWQQNNRQALAVLASRRRARVKGGDLTKDKWKAVLASWNGRCACCQTDANITMDHIIPVSIGGKNSVNNVQPLCGHCNSSKRAKAFSYLRPVFVGVNNER